VICAKSLSKYKLATCNKKLNKAKKSIAQFVMKREEILLKKLHASIVKHHFLAVNIGF